MSGSKKPKLDLIGLQFWADEIRNFREPDFIIGDNYLRRWWVLPRNELFNVYLHEINHDDDDRALHDHPWDNTSILLKGNYREVTPIGVFIRCAGDIVERQAADAHRLMLLDNEQVISLFITGPIIREWGFHCPQGWRHWKEYTQLDGNHSTIGKGCAD